MSSLEEATKGVVGFTLGGGPSSARMYEEAASLSDLERKSFSYDNPIAAFELVIDDDKFLMRFWDT